MKYFGMAESSQELEPDEFAANTEIADTVLGFHAQQAIEKWLKAVLVATKSTSSTRTTFVTS